MILRECLLAAMLAARSILANNSPPKRLFNGFVSPGKTKSVKTATDSEGVFGCIVFFAKVGDNQRFSVIFLKLFPLFPTSFFSRNFFLIVQQELPSVALPAKEKIVF